jgi:hypothetical protein
LRAAYFLKSNSISLRLVEAEKEAALCDAGQSPLELLRRHQSGDWGELCEADKRENELSVEHGFRILSAYRTARDVRLWVITEADRSVTTILLPEEY